MSEPAQPGHRPTERTADERAADHAAIDRLSEELLPALIAKLGATGLGELEVREGGWRVRLRRPAEGAAPVTRDRRTGDRDRTSRAGGTGSATANPGAHASLTPVGPGRDGRDGRDGRNGSGAGHDGGWRDGRLVATSPAVGIYRPRPEARAGTKVRAGDRLGSVDMLGIAQEVVAPADGVVGVSLVEAGDAVEYGQELILIEFASTGAGAGAEA